MNRENKRMVLTEGEGEASGSDVRRGGGGEGMEVSRERLGRANVRERKRERSRETSDERKGADVAVFGERSTAARTVAAGRMW